MEKNHEKIYNSVLKIERGYHACYRAWSHENPLPWADIAYSKRTSLHSQYSGPHTAVIVILNIRHRGSTSASATVCVVSAPRDRVDHMWGVLHAHPPVVFSVLNLTAVVGSRLDLERKKGHMHKLSAPHQRHNYCCTPVHCCAHCYVVIYACLCGRLPLGLSAGLYGDLSAHKVIVRYHACSHERVNPL